jgi:hypothetical protein
MKIVDAVQIAANAGWPNAPNREGRGFANIAEEFTSALKLISEDWRASESAEKDGNAFFGGSGPCVHQDSRRCLFIPVARGKNRPDVQALRNVRQRYGKIWRHGFSGLVDAGPRIDPVFSWDRQA